jgi:hypothetical protein
MLVQYHPNGTRELIYQDPEDRFANIIQVCDGKDLIEQSSYHLSSGNSLERSVGHAACADGQLTPLDFEAAPMPPSPSPSPNVK